MQATPNQILEYWYSPENRACWFSSTPQLDQSIRNTFEPLFQSASLGELDDWMQTPEGCLALIIVLDQLPLNMYRGTPQSFKTEQQAVYVCKYAIKNKYDKQLPKDRLGFLYMPLMHSEKPDDQDLAVSLYTEAQLESNLHFAQHHRKIIRRFGRFPHRNRILNRNSTTAEIEYLASKSAFLG